MYKFNIPAVKLFERHGPPIGTFDQSDRMVVYIHTETKSAWSSWLVGNPQLASKISCTYGSALDIVFHTFANKVHFDWRQHAVIYEFNIPTEVYFTTDADRPAEGNVVVLVNKVAETVQYGFVYENESVPFYWEDDDFNQVVEVILKHFATEEHDV